MSCADVCLSHDYDVEMGFCTEKIVRARKPHRCCECGVQINAGELYERASGKTDGSMWTITSCMPCAEIRNAFVCGSWVYGMLWESIRDEMFPMWRTKGAWDCLAKLTTDTAVAKCNAEYREWYTDNGYDLAEPATSEVQP